MAECWAYARFKFDILGGRILQDDDFEAGLEGYPGLHFTVGKVSTNLTWDDTSAKTGITGCLAFEPPCLYNNYC